MPIEAFVAILGASLLFTAWALWLLPVGTCPECAHCRAERLARQRAEEAQASRIYGIPFCATCGRHHDRREGHRT
jgi:hypothetical protein